MSIIRRLVAVTQVLGDAMINGTARGRMLESLIYHGIEQNSRVSVFRNLILPYGGNTSEIDVMFVTSRYIAVIECKDYSGSVFGNQDNEVWHHIVNCVDYSFYNPIMQNATHISAIKNITDTTLPIVSLIIFGSGTHIGSLNYTDSSTLKIGTLDYAQQMLEDIDTVFITRDYAESSRVAHILSSYSNCTKEERQKHIKSRRYCRDYQQYGATMVCPRCGHPLKLRSGRRGKFWGCSRYPSCKYTRSL